MIREGIREADFSKRSGLEFRTSDFEDSGGRVSNAWITCLADRDNTGKLVLIPDTLLTAQAEGRKGETRRQMGPRPIS